VERTWKPTAAAILDIVSGASGLIQGLIIRLEPSWWSLFGPSVVVLLVIAGILAIVGGAYAAQRKKWGLALAGSLFAVLNLGGQVMGIAAVMLTMLSKNEFK